MLSLLSFAFAAASPLPPQFPKLPGYTYLANITVYDDPAHPESELTFVFTSGKFNATAEWDNPDPSKATDALFHFFSLPHTGCLTWSSNATAAPCKACGCPDPLPNPIPPEAVLVSEHEATQVWYVNSSPGCCHGASFKEEVPACLFPVPVALPG